MLTDEQVEVIEHWARALSDTQLALHSEETLRDIRKQQELYLILDREVTNRGHALLEQLRATEATDG